MKAIPLFNFKKLQIILVCLFTFVFCYSKEFEQINYVTQSWNSDNGLPSNVITSINQDSHGYIYFGTYIGLVKFNGSTFSTINRNTDSFIPFISARVIFKDSKEQFWIGSNDSGVSIFSKNHTDCSIFPTGLSNNSIRSITETKDGEIWIGTTNGIVRCKNEKQTVIIPNPENNGLTDSNIVKLYCDSFNQIWCITSLGNIYIYSDKDKKFNIYEPSFIQNQKVSAIFQDSKDNFWFGLNNNSVIMVKSDNATIPTDNSEYEIYTGKDGIIDECDITSFMEDNSNSIWIGTDRGIIIIKNGKTYFFTQSEGLTNNAVSCIFLDKENNIWIGTDQKGVQKLTKSRFAFIPTKEAVNCVLNDNSMLWIGTDLGLYCYKNGIFIENEITELCKSLRIRHLAKTNDGSLLISTYSNLGQLIIKDNKITSLNEQDGLLINKVRVALEMSNGNLAIGTTKGLNILNKDTGKISTYTTLNGLTNDFIMSLWEDTEKRLWIGTDGGGINIMSDNKIQQTFTSKENNLAGDIVFKITQDKNGIFWICTGTGLTRYDRKTFFNYNRSNGLGYDSIFQILIDQQDLVWIISNGGISSVNLSQLENLATGQKKSLNIRHYNKSDGLSSKSITSTALSAIDEKGKLYFTMTEGVSVYDFKQVNNIIPPPAVIEGIDTGKEIIQPSLNSKIIIPANNKRITINYSGLTYVSLEKVYFKYQLIGFDTEPSELTSLHHVSYTNLKPGKYTFNLKVVNSDGVWSDNTAQVSFIKKAYFYQNPLFIVSIIILIAIAIFVFFKLKFRIMEIRERKLQKIIAEKTQALENEMNKSERLLLNILPEPIAKRLKYNNEIIADSFKDVSILFSDIIGFTKISSQYTPNIIVAALNDLFSRFDTRALEMGVEKIKTLGDAYIAVCGMPRNDSKHAIRILEFAHGMLQDIEEYNQTSIVKFSMRIGINSGEVTAGVIGKTKFIYDIWGDAVNVASRMEYYGIANKITVSESTYNLTKDYVNYEEDFTEIKGKGKMHIFRTT